MSQDHSPHVQFLLDAAVLMPYQERIDLALALLEREHVPVRAYTPQLIADYASDNFMFDTTTSKGDQTTDRIVELLLDGEVFDVRQFAKLTDDDREAIGNQIAVALDYLGGQGEINTTPDYDTAVAEFEADIDGDVIFEYSGVAVEASRALRELNPEGYSALFHEWCVQKDYDQAKWA